MEIMRNNQVIQQITFALCRIRILVTITKKVKEKHRTPSSGNQFKTMNKEQLFQNQEAQRIAQNANQLNNDFDGDGLTTGEELQMGLNPYEADTDGDRKLDGEEIISRGEPGRFEFSRSSQNFSKKEQLRQEYYTIASGMFDSNQIQNWPELCQNIKGNKTIGQSLDYMVFRQSIAHGKSIEQAAYLLAQSPFLQWHYQQGHIDFTQMADYTNAIIYEYYHPLKKIIRENLDEQLID